MTTAQAIDRIIELAEPINPARYRQHLSTWHEHQLQQRLELLEEEQSKPRHRGRWVPYKQRVS